MSEVNTYYEAHVTMLGSPQHLEPLVTALRWKFSSIDGDPTLGTGIKCYATRHFKSSRSQNDVLAELHGAADALGEQGIGVIRRKIELVVYDDRSSTVRFACNGGCAECHSD